MNGKDLLKKVLNAETENLTKEQFELWQDMFNHIALLEKENEFLLKRGDDAIVKYGDLERKISRAKKILSNKN